MSDPVDRLNKALEGPYRIESELGEGGMATVYLAEDVKHVISSNQFVTTRNRSGSTSSVPGDPARLEGGKFVLALRRTEGGWLIFADMDNGN